MPIDEYEQNSIVYLMFLYTIYCYCETHAGYYFSIIVCDVLWARPNPAHEAQEEGQNDKIVVGQSL